MAEKTPCSPRCKEFEAMVVVSPRYADKNRVCAMVRVRCADCKINYRFVGLERGSFSGMEPSTVSQIGYEAMLPIEMVPDPEQDAAIDTADSFDKQKTEIDSRNATAEQPSSP
jgi:hypothetical protein